MIDDEPIRTREADKLNQRRYAALVAEAALGTTGPFTVGVYGGWGQGKTSLLKHAKDLLDQRSNDSKRERLYPQVVTVFFNAWRYEREAHPIVPLVATIAAAVQKRIDEDTTLPQEAGRVIKRWWSKIVDAGKAVAGSTKFEAKGRLGNPAIGQAEAGVGFDVGAAQKNYKENHAARAEGEELKTELWIKQSLYLSAFDDLESMWDEEVIKVATPSNPAPRLVVFVDDLDRCQPEKAFELLEGIKLALAQPGFIFVLALNAEIITRYLAQEARKRYGEDHIRLGERYLDKIVQLEVPLRSHKREFPGFIEQTVMKTLGGAIGDATGTPPKHFADAVLSLKELLGRFTDHTPRTLVRRLNSLIVDERLLPEDAPFEARKKDEKEREHVARRRGYYMGLLLVQRTLVEMPGVGVAAVRALHEHNELCERIAAEGLEPLYDALKPRENDLARSAATETASNGLKSDDKTDKKQQARWLNLLAPFRGREEASDVWQTEPGKAWLADHAGRTAVVELVALRPALQSPQLGSATSPGVIDDPEAHEAALIDRVIRRKLKLGANVPITPETRGKVTDLNLNYEPITDTGAAWLANSNTGLNALTKLLLGGTRVTDAGVQALARADTGLKALTTLYLAHTKVTDAGVKELARADTGLKVLTTLHLGYTKVRDEGVKELARADTGLKALIELFLDGTRVTEAGARAIRKARPELKIFR